jgi:hypothetical protein
MDSLSEEFELRTGLVVNVTKPAVGKSLPDYINIRLYRVEQESLKLLLILAMPHIYRLYKQIIFIYYSFKKIPNDFDYVSFFKFVSGKLRISLLWFRLHKISM